MIQELIATARRTTPSLIADEITSVQPMANMMNPFTKKWEKIGMDMLADKWVYNVRLDEIRNWIEEQPVHMWKHYDIPDHSLKEVSINAFIGQNYIFTEEMEAWFTLRWS